MKLNGWKRLWIIFSILWVLTVAFYIGNYRNTASEMYYYWANDLIEYLVSQDTELKNYSVTSLRSVYSNISDKELIGLLHNKYLKKHPAYKYGFSEVDRKYENKIDSGGNSLFIQLLIAVIVPLAVYLFGWAFCWVRQGFSNA